MNRLLRATILAAIDGTAAAAEREWYAQGWDSGRWIQGVFDAAHGTEARMVGGFLAEKQ